jgi:hypothetical protein
MWLESECTFVDVSLLCHAQFIYTGVDLSEKFV